MSSFTNKQCSITSVQCPVTFPLSTFNPENPKINTLTTSVDPFFSVNTAANVLGQNKSQVIAKSTKIACGPDLELGPISVSSITPVKDQISNIPLDQLTEATARSSGFDIPVVKLCARLSRQMSALLKVPEIVNVDVSQQRNVESTSSHSSISSISSSSSNHTSKAQVK